MEKVTGELEVGTNGRGDVVVNHPRIEQTDDGGHLIFSPEQVRLFGEDS